MAVVQTPVAQSPGQLGLQQAHFKSDHFTCCLRNRYFLDFIDEEDKEVENTLGKKPEARVLPIARPKIRIVTAAST